MKIFAEISAGDLVDKITILEIKLENIQDEEKRENILREYAALSDTLQQAIGTHEAVADLRRQLKAVNAELWQIEDSIREMERAKMFAAEFIALARSVYQTNDRRAFLKRQINTLTNSNLIEEKSYSAY
jgi:hypothetical protein